MPAAEADSAKKRVRGEPFQIASKIRIGRFEMSNETDDERFICRQIENPLVIFNPLACFNDYCAGYAFRHGQCFVVVGQDGAVKHLVIRIRPRHSLWPGGFVEMRMCINNHLFNKAPFVKKVGAL